MPQPIIPEPPDEPSTTHDTAVRPPQPIQPKLAAGTSPLVDRISSNVTEIHVTPAFGDRLHVQLIGNHEMPEIAVGAMAAVTIYGNGRIEYHPEFGGEQR